MFKCYERKLTFLRIVAADVRPLLWGENGFISHHPASMFEPIEDESPREAFSVIVRPFDFCRIRRVTEPKE